MTYAAKALLKSEGKTDYRGCNISYYTYSMLDKPNVFRIGANVHIQAPQNIYTKTLAIDNEFNTENEAINFGIDYAKKSIDIYYETVKIPAEKTTATT